MGMTHSAMSPCIDMDSVRNTQTCRTGFIDIAELEFGGAWARSVSMNASERMYKWSLIVQLTVLLRYGIRYTQIRTKIHACTNRSIPVHYEIRSNDSTYDIHIYIHDCTYVSYIYRKCPSYTIVNRSPFDVVATATNGRPCTCGLGAQARLRRFFRGLSERVYGTLDE